MTLHKWLRRAAVDDGGRAGRSESQELRDAKKWIRLLEQELRRAAAYLSQANLPGKGSTRS